MAAFSLITFSEPGFVLAPGSRLQWFQDNREPKDTEHELMAAYLAVIREEAQDFLSQAYEADFTEGSNFDYALIVDMALGDGATAEDILRRYRLTPSFPASRRYKRGTVVAAVFSNSEQRIVWRGAVQANIDSKQSAEERRPVIKQRAARLLQNIPRS